MMLTLSQTGGFLVVGLVTAMVTAGSGWLAYRASRETNQMAQKTGEVSAAQGAIELALTGLTQVGVGQGQLITDLRKARDEDREAIADLQSKWERCEADKAQQAAEIADLRRRIT